MGFLDKLHHPEKYFRILFKWGILGVMMGLVGGLVGAFFAHTLGQVTTVREGFPWLIYFLPIAGLATVALYRIFKMRSNRGTNEIIDAVLKNQPLKPAIAPVIFIASALTHLFGGSAGREGAALQLGGSCASALSRLFRLKDEERTVLIMSGMAAVFAGLFGTPLTATFFCMEFESVGTFFSPALLPCFLAAFVASKVSLRLGVHPETSILNTTFDFGVISGLQLLVLAVAIGLLGIVMCILFHKASHLGEKWLKNPWVRIAVGGILIIGLTLLVGDQRYNGAGMHMALHAVEGHANWYDFALKLLFTAITLAAGFKGGEIVPTFCIGATFGCVLGGLIGLDPGFAAALGLVGLFCCATNSPIASILLSIEMFGGSNVLVFTLVCVVAYVISGNWGLYQSQIIQFSKARLTLKNKNSTEP